MRIGVTLAILMAMTSTAFAGGGFDIVIPGRPGVPVIINGVDASYAVVEGDWGLAKRIHVQPTIYGGRYIDPVPNVGHYYPSAGHLPGYGRLEIGRWVHIGDGNSIRCHEGSLRIGDKVVLGRDNVINTYLDIELGDSVLMADWCYVCDFDHRMDSIELPIKDQGIIKGPVRIGPDTWVATKVTVLRGTSVGRGCVLGSHAVVKGEIPDFSIAVGAPAKVVKNRQLSWESSAAQRAELAAALADIERKKAAR